LTHGAGSIASITAGSAEWILLSVVYHYVLTQSPSPEAAKITVLTAWENGQLRLRAEVREHEARPNLKLEPGEQPPEIQPKCEPVLASDKLRHWDWDWERSYATRRDETTRSLFAYANIVRDRDDVLRLWPPAEMTVRVETPDTAVAKPVGVSSLVWAVVLTLDEMESQSPADLASLTQKHLTRKVGEKLQRGISERTLQKAVAFRRKRNGPRPGPGFRK
jgi:predicted DNA-binding protein (UPF0251 family)